jgi:hypothetical protein
MKKRNILLSFIGTNDAGKIAGNEDGAILTALNERKYDKVILFWNDSKTTTASFKEISNYLKSEILKRKYSSKVELVKFSLNDVTNHNEIYPVLKNFCDTLPKQQAIEYTAAISSGTPSMQVCWILLAESGDFSKDFPLNLIRIRDPKFGKPSIIPVKLDTSLPKIILLQNEVDTLKKDLIPLAEINIEKGTLNIGRDEVPLSPIEFSYYRYFAERVLDREDSEKISGLYISNSFLQKVYKYHEESFPALDVNREEMRKLLKSERELSITTFRGNISKLNKKINETIKNSTLSKLFQITIEGKRGAKFYGIKAEKEKILVR